MHVQTGLWFCEWHWALNPQDPMQGSWHFWFKQARFEGHSSSIIHSGRQFGGMPSILILQEHTALPSTTWHWELGPHGLGKHGFTFLGGSIAIYKIKKKKLNFSAPRISIKYFKN